jgi:hypothetical protein
MNPEVVTKVSKDPVIQNIHPDPVLNVLSRCEKIDLIEN